MTRYSITKIILKNGLIRDYYYNEHNTSYPTLESLKKDHTNLDKLQINSFFKNGHGAETPKQTTVNHTSSKEMIYNV